MQEIKQKMTKRYNVLHMTCNVVMCNRIASFNVVMCNGIAKCNVVMCNGVASYNAVMCIVTNDILIFDGHL